MKPGGGFDGWPATIRNSLPLGLEGRNLLPSSSLFRYTSITGLHTQLCSTIMDWVTAVWAMLMGACAAMAVPQQLVGISQDAPCKLPDPNLAKI
jgi:hypothetical protein